MTKRLLSTILCAFLFSVLTVSAQNYSPVERGMAVYYADYLEGQPTAYGEIYRKDQLTAAHRTHPAGTMLKVTRLDNRRSVIVRVNDRGAYCDGCVVDLSKIAALQLDLLRSGTAMVAVEVVNNNNAIRNDLAARNPYTATRTTSVNRHSTYPRPDAGFGSSSLYTSTSNYSDPDRPVNYSISEQPTSYSNPSAQARTPITPRTYAAPQPQPKVQAKAPPAMTSYNYYQAQAAQQSTTPKTTARSEQATYERLRARGLLPEEEAKDSDAAFYSRGGLAQPPTQPRNYEQNPEPRINAKGSANPTAYIQWNNTPTSTTPPKYYSAESSYPTTYNTTTTRSPKGSYGIQVASYRNFGNAQRQLSELRGKGLINAYLLETSNSGGKLYKVLNGPFKSKEAAMNELSRYKKELLVDGIVILLK